MAEGSFDELPTQFGQTKLTKIDNRKGISSKDAYKIKGQIVIPERSQRKRLKEIGPELKSSHELPTFPTTQEFQVGEAGKGITALHVNKNGSKFYTGEYNARAKFWNLSTMNAFGNQTFVNIDLDLGYHVVSIDATSDEKLILLALYTPEISLFDHTGLRKAQSRRGDMYLYDTTNTYGHTAAVTCAQFRPGHDQNLASTSQDGTLRFWDVSHMEHQAMMYRLGSRGGVRNPGRHLAWDNNGDGVYLVSDDRFLSYFSEKGETNLASMKLQLPTVGGQIAVAPNGVNVAVRAFDDYDLTMWDIRKTDSPVWTSNASSKAPGVAFSPDSAHLAVPETVPKGSIYGGRLSFLGSGGGELEGEVPLQSGVGATVLEWNEKTNQIYVGCSDGIARIFFDASASRKGAMLAIARGIYQRTETDNAVIGELIPRLIDPEQERVIRGFWFPYSSEELRNKRESALPKAPLWGEGHHGQLAVHPVQQELVELGQVDTPDTMDILEAIRRHKKDAELGYFTKSHAKRPEDEDTK